MRYISPLVAATVITLLNTACSSSSKNSEETTDSIVAELPRVDIQQVNMQEVPQIATYTATIEAFKTNNIATSTPNRIKNILVDVGSKVNAGQRVVVLDAVNTDQLKVNIDEVTREYNRAKQLLEIGGGTQQAVDQLKSQLDGLNRQYTNLMENTVLTTPVTGVVTARNYDPGDMTGNQPILTIEQVRPVKVIINVSESEFTKVKKGMKAKINLDVYGNEEFNGTVSLIHPSIDPATRTFTVEITIPNNNEKVLPGMFARVTMDFGVQPHVVVPDRAVVKQSGSGNKYVYVYNPGSGTVSFNQVELGQRIDNTYEIISGVSNGDLVVIAGQSKLINGSKVEVNNKNNIK